MKKIICSLLFALTANNVQAESILDDTVFGVSLIHQNVNLSVNDSGTTVNTDESGTGFGVYLDKYYKRKYRFNSTFSYVGFVVFDLAELSFSADYLVLSN